MSKYVSKPCPKCGGIIYYKNSGTCFNCQAGYYLTYQYKLRRQRLAKLALQRGEWW